MNRAQNKLERPGGGNLSEWRRKWQKHIKYKVKCRHLESKKWNYCVYNKNPRKAGGKMKRKKCLKKYWNNFL